MKRVLIVLAVIIGLSLIWALVKSSNKSEPVAKPITQQPAKTPEQIALEKQKAESDKVLANAKAEYAKNQAMKPFDVANYPKMYEKYGTEAMQRVNATLPDIGNKISKSKYCDQLATSGISERSTRENMVVFVYCENMAKYYISENYLKSGMEILPETTKR